MVIPQLILTMGGVYSAIGLVFAIAFVTVGAARLDRGAHGAPICLRLLLVPGAAALWPILLFKWCTKS